MKIKGLYVKRGWYYYQPPMVEGVRPSAVALRTADYGKAVDEAFRLHTANALHAQTKERMSVLVADYVRLKRASGEHTAKTSDTTSKILTRLSKDWDDPRVVTIDRKKVEEWRDSLRVRGGMKGEGFADSSVSSYLHVLRGFLSWLVSEKFIRCHPMAEIKLGRVKKTRRERFCTLEERELLLKDPPSEEIEFILYFGFFAGLRFGEMLAMQPNWLERLEGRWLLTVQGNEFFTPKDKEARTIEVHPRIAKFLESYGIKSPFMLAPKRKTWKEAPAYRFNPKKQFKTHAEKCGLGWVSYHTLRHSFATHLALAGARMVEIAQALGDSLQVTEATYVGYAPSSLSSISKI